MRFVTNANSRMNISADGLVGIGTEGQTHKFQVNGDISSSGDFYTVIGKKVIFGDALTKGGWLEGTDNHLELRHVQGTSEAAIQVDTYGMIKFANHWNGQNPGTNLDINADLKMIISGSNVGIGTSTPRKRLHIVNSGIAITGGTMVETQDPWDDARFIIDAGASTAHSLMKVSNDDNNCLWVQGDRVYMNVPVAIGQENLNGYGGVTADENDLVVNGQFSAGGSAGSAIYKLQIGDTEGMPANEGDLNIGNILKGDGWDIQKDGDASLKDVLLASATIDGNLTVTDEGDTTVQGTLHIGTDGQTYMWNDGTY